MSIWSRIERRLEEFANDLLPDEYSERLAKARRLLEEGATNDAEILLAALAADRPTHAPAQVLLGEAKRLLGKFDEAATAFDRAIQIDDELADAQLGRGECALALGKPGEALGHFRKAMEAASGDRELLAEAYRGMGLCQRQLGDLDKAIRELRKAVAESPDDARAIAALGDALSADTRRSNSEARRYLQRLTSRDGCPGMAWLALGRICLQEGDADAAIENFSQVDSDRDSDIIGEALRGRVRAHLLRGEVETAAELLQLLPSEAVHGASEQADTLALRAHLAGLQGNTDGALRLYQQSLAASDRLATAEEALKLAMHSGAIDEGVRLANRVLSERPDDASALTARAIELRQRGEIEAAVATLESVLGHGEHHRALLELAGIQLRDGKHSEAAKLARRALRHAPGDAEATKLWEESSAAALGIRIGEGANWFDLASAAARLCAQHPALLELLPQARTALAEFDQPLLVAVMGEFSSGKSSFVNAFVGADVAPTGITPTTATINIVKYGRERGGRVIYQDDTSRELDGKDLGTALAAIDEHEARRVRHVEILMPIPVLERVNIIDTPGLNSILPEHEAVARAFLKRADAVVWLFTANQAGKSSEKLALDSIREQGVRVLGALNKVDQLSDEQLRDVLRHVHGELANRVESCVPISARRALAGEANSGWDEMRAELEERFFSHARDIKRHALRRRLLAFLDNAERAAKSNLGELASIGEDLKRAASCARDQALHFVDTVVSEERARMTQAASALYKSAATEVLDLVRPRKLPFGSHKASRADRDYLLGLLESGYEQLLDASASGAEAALAESARKALSEVPSDEAGIRQSIEDEFQRGLKLLRAEAFGRCLAFLRGYLRGGFVDHFFRNELPKVELDEERVFTLLFRGAPELDGEISMPLATAGSALLEELASRLEDWEHDSESLAASTDAGLGRVLDRLRGQLTRLSQSLEGQAAGQERGDGENNDGENNDGENSDGENNDGENNDEDTHGNQEPS